jgi:hypothetical protein
LKKNNFYTIYLSQYNVFLPLIIFHFFLCIFVGSFFSRNTTIHNRYFVQTTVSDEAKENGVGSRGTCYEKVRDKEEAWKRGA